MVKTSGSWLPEHRPPWEHYTSENCMFAPVEYKTCGFSPAATNLYNISNLGLNGPGFLGFPKYCPPYEANDLIPKLAFPSPVLPLTPSEYVPEQTSLFQARVDVLTSTDGAPSQQKKFLIFDKCGKETRLIDSTSLFPYNATVQTRYSYWSQLVAEDQPNTRELVRNEKYVIPEESGENEAVDEGSEMREDTEEINALLYSDDDGDESEDDDDEVSTGHSPSMNQEHDFDDVASFDRYTKRQKTLDGGHNKSPFSSATTMENRTPSHETTDGGELVCSSDEEGSSPTIGNKRVRNDKIRDTLRVLESIVPGLKSKDPAIILDEAINYLKSLKSSAETMSMEDPDGSSCYGPSS